MPQVMHVLLPMLPIGIKAVLDGSLARIARVGQSLADSITCSAAINPRVVELLDRREIHARIAIDARL